MGALCTSLLRCLAAGFRPPPMEPPTSSVTTATHHHHHHHHRQWLALEEEEKEEDRERERRVGETGCVPGRAATVNRNQRGCSWAELFSGVRSVRVCVYVCVCARWDGGSAGGWRREENDGRYAKRACVTVTHQLVSQCVDVTWMQMCCKGYLFL